MTVHHPEGTRQPRAASSTSSSSSAVISEYPHLLFPFPKPETAEAPVKQVSHHVSESRRISLASLAHSSEAADSPTVTTKHWQRETALRGGREGEIERERERVNAFAAELISEPLTLLLLHPPSSSSFFQPHFYYDLIVSCLAPPTLAHAPASGFYRPRPQPPGFFNKFLTPPHLPCCNHILKPMITAGVTQSQASLMGRYQREFV